MDDETINIDKNEINKENDNKNDKKVIFKILDVLGYVLVAIGLFLANVKFDVMPQICDSNNTCVDVPSQATSRLLLPKAVGWSVFGVGIALIIVMIVLKVIKNKNRHDY